MDVKGRAGIVFKIIKSSRIKKAREGNAKMKGTRRESGGIGEKGGKKCCRRRSALSSRDKKKPLTNVRGFSG